MRGQSLFSELQQVNAESPGVSLLLPEATRKGRSEELNEARDLMLAQRYLFYITHTSYRLEVIYEKLSVEFWLSIRRIEDLLSQRAAYLRQERKEPPTITQLRSRYPHWVWNSNK